MTRLRPTRTRRILLLGTPGLLLLLASWLYSSKGPSTLQFIIEPPLPKWGCSFTINSGTCRVLAGTYHDVWRRPLEAGISFDRTSVGSKKLGDGATPKLEFDKELYNFHLEAPHWFLVFVYILVWMVILAEPRSHRRLKQPRPPA